MNDGVHITGFWAKLMHQSGGGGSNNGDDKSSVAGYPQARRMSSVKNVMDNTYGIKSSITFSKRTSKVGDVETKENLKRRRSVKHNSIGAAMFSQGDELPGENSSICRRMWGPYHPYSRMRRRWDYAVTFVLLYCLFEVPLRVGLRNPGAF